MPLGISGTFNFMLVFQAEHNILMHPLQPKKLSNPTSTPFDPLANFTGATNHGNLAQQIDQDLYE